MNTAIWVASQLIQRGRVERGYLGVSAETFKLDRRIAVASRIEAPTVVRLTEVQPGSAAAAAGLRVGDLVVRANHRPIATISRSYAYQSKGYYASLLAEARGHRVVPTVETMLELREAKLYEHALPELEDLLNRCARRADFQPDGEFKLLVCFGITRDPRFEAFGHLLFDWFRCPALEVASIPAALATRSSASACGPSPGSQTARRRSCATRCTAIPRANGATPRRARSPNTTSRCSTIRTRSCRRPRPPPSSISPASPRNTPSTSSRSPGASSPSSPNMTGSSSARPPRSTITPIASPAAPGRKACRSSTIRSR